ncbi:carboxylate--amine ligase [Serinibacter arcticus]|uniref:Putative glutamate--cysteine ligase 2 n=1 Tax=Serinibacter arcticus TaxID=1655435 RepID=A0A2U1ZZY7_9MICO|nr:glutamate--cysteine ligase [Serinibacter arcticus]PWD52545.1 carboxylate--amine ligase [Serinibacter arcticus]
MRTVGVEEEYVLVGSDGSPVARASAALALGDAVEGHRPSGDGGPGGDIEGELVEQQIETSTPVCTELADIGVELRAARRRTQAAAERVGADIVAVGTSPLPVTVQIRSNERYDGIKELLALSAREQLTSGTHVHVGVADDEEGVRVIDRIRPWLSVLTALSANSPYWQGEDSGYASYRSSVFGRWPSTGPTELFGDAATYHAVVEGLVASGAILDEAMVYFDARLSARYPTVEVRVGDVMLEAEHAVTLAGLARALVTTAARSEEPPSPVRMEVLRLMGWRAARSGIAEQLVSPVTFRPLPASAVVAELLEHVGEALEETGDAAVVRDGVAHLAETNGARVQREWFAQSGSLATVVRRAHARTVA